MNPFFVLQLRIVNLNSYEYIMVLLTHGSTVQKDKVNIRFYSIRLRRINFHKKKTK